MALLWYNIGVGLISKLRCLTTSRNVGNDLSEPIECLMAALSEGRRTKVFGSGRLPSAILNQEHFPPITVGDVKDFYERRHYPGRYYTKCMEVCPFCGKEVLKLTMVSGMVLCDECAYLQWRWLNLVWRKLSGALGLREKYLKAEADRLKQIYLLD